MTLSELYQSTKRLKAGLIDSSKYVNISSFNVTVDTRKGLKVFSAIAKDAKSNTRRQVVMAFTPQDDSDLVDLTAFVPNFKYDQVKVSSGSPWYKFTLQNANKKVRAHFGPIERYSVKGTGRSQNSKGIPGMDKHLLAFMRELISNRLVTQ